MRIEAHIDAECKLRNRLHLCLVDQLYGTETEYVNEPYRALYEGLLEQCREQLVHLLLGTIV